MSINEVCILDLRVIHVSAVSHGFWLVLDLRSRLGGKLGMLQACEEFLDDEDGTLG